MRLATEEREHWDALAAGDPDFEVWAESGDGVDRCLAEFEADLDVHPGNLVLDLGCGVGRLTAPLAARYPTAEFVGVDVSSRMLEVARERHHTVTWIQGDGRALPPLPRPLDRAFSVVTFQHLEDSVAQVYLRQVAEVLRPGGVFCFQFVEGIEQSAYSQQRTVGDVGDWCDQLGLSHTARRDSLLPAWIWVKVVK